MAPRSLFDAVDLAAVRTLAIRLPGAGAAPIACLAASGSVEHDPDDPAWRDRDRVIVGSPGLLPAVAAAGLPRDDGDPLAAAADSVSSGGIYRVFWLLEAGGDGLPPGVWDTLVAAGQQGVDALTCVIVAPDAVAGWLAGLVRAAGWRAFPATAADVAEVLGALDQAVAAAGAPSAIVAGAGRPSPPSSR